MKNGRLKKRLLSFLVLCVMAFVFATCGGKEEPKRLYPDAETGNATMLSRADYVGLVGEVFGFDEYETKSDFFPDVLPGNQYYKNVQACAEWNVISVGDNFEPDNGATLEFALATAVKAIGLDNLGLNPGMDDKTLADYYVSNIAMLDTANLDKGITDTVGRQILKYAQQYGGDIELPQQIDIQYVEGVKNADDSITVPLSGNIGTLKGNHGYQVGDVVYFENTASGYPRGIKITAISDDQYTFEDATIEEVFSQLEVSGTFDGEIINAYTASDNVSFGKDEIYYPDGRTQNVLSPTAAVGVKSDIDRDRAVFSVHLPGDNGSADLRMGIENIKITVDYKHAKWNPLNPEKVQLSVKYDSIVDLKADYHNSRTIPLGCIDVRIWGPLCVRMSLTANIGVNGVVEFNYSLHNYAAMDWKKGNGITKTFSSQSSSTFSGQVTLTAEATAMADLIIKFAGTHSITNVQATSGLVVIAKLDEDLLGNDPSCLDVYGYVPLRWGVNQKGCLVTGINKDWKGKGVIWDSKSSEITFHFHFEDGEQVTDGKCTRGEAKEVVQEAEKPDGEPLDEYELFDFEPLKFDFIELREYITFLDQNDVYEIIFDGIPEGYTKDSLNYAVADPAICSVSSGIAKGLQSGSTLIKISTPDGMFSCIFVVVVNHDYSIGGFQNL